jgi:hypothetical protein
LTFQPQIEPLNYRLHRKNLAHFPSLLFRPKTPKAHPIVGKIAFKIAHFSKMRQTLNRFFIARQGPKSPVNLKIFPKKKDALAESLC